MSVSGGSFSAGRVFRGGSQSTVPSSFYMGFWPMQQADGDADDEQVTDRSGKGSHATLGSLSSAEAWANAGYLTSLDEDAHSAQLPIVYWTHRMATRSLLVSFQMKAAKGASSLRCWGCGVSQLVTGPMINITSAGAVQFAINNSLSGSIVTWTGTVATPYATDTLHTIGIVYDHETGGVSYYVDGAFVTTSTNVSAANIVAADAAYPAYFSLSGRPAGGAARQANTMRFQHAFDLPSAPSNAAALMQRLHAHPRLMLRDLDFAF